VRRSTDRIIVSHAGTLPRPTELQKLFVGGEASTAAFEAALPEAIDEVVKKQAEIGIDVVNDGEFSKRGGFLGYVRERMTGFEERPELAKQARDAGVTGRDQRDFPGFYAAGLGMFYHGNQETVSPVAGGFNAGPFVAKGPLTYIGHANVAADIARLKEACEGLDVEPYLPAVAPGTIEHWLYRGDSYKDDEEFLFAIADVMHEEYKAITDAGVVLQIDDPDMPDAWQMFPSMTVPEYRKYASLRAEAQNHALRGLPESLIRFHVCWGSQHGPHRASNGRHAHEWQVFEDFKLPEGKSLMPGVIGHSSDVIEHPELVAERLVRYANLVGRENVIAGTDCGLGSRVGHGEIAWAKLEDMAKGAALASKQLWK
jgi:5-methyltetrahydropteroyltriglutamate--homocysteine methyltransferase